MKHQPTLNILVKMCQSSPGCVGYEWVGPRDIRVAYKPETSDAEMFDVWFDSGAKVVGESPLKANEAGYPYTRYLICWPEPALANPREREGLYTCKPQKKPTPDL